MSEFYIEDDGVRLHAKLDRPEGAERCDLAIVFHGLTGHMEERHIAAVASTLNEAGVATLRVELYGHGGSGGTFHDHTLYKWINNALAVVDYARHLDFVDALYLCGHSQGGLLSMLLAGMCPDRFAGIMPLSPALVIVDGAREGKILGATFDPAHVPDEIGIPGRVSLDGNYVRVAQTLRPDEAIARYDGPVLLVHGTDDEMVPVQYSIDAASAYSNARLELIEGDDHGYHRHLDQMTNAVQNFITSHAARVTS